MITTICTHLYPGTSRVFHRVIPTSFQFFVVVSCEFRITAARGSIEERVYQLSCFITIGHELGFRRRSREAKPSIISNVCLTVFVRFRRDDNHAKACTSSVDGGRSGILQDRNRLDIVGIDPIDVTLNTIDEHQWSTRILQRSGSTDVQFGSFAGHTRAERNIEVGHLTLQHLTNTAYRTVFQFIRSHQTNRPNEVRLFLGTIADHHHFVQSFRLFFQRNVHTLARFQRLRSKSHVRNGEQIIGIHLQRELSVDIGCCAVASSFLRDGSSDDRFSGSVGHRSRDGSLSRLFAFRCRRMLVRCQGDLISRCTESQSRSPTKIFQNVYRGSIAQCHRHFIVQQFLNLCIIQEDIVAILLDITEHTAHCLLLCGNRITNIRQPIGARGSSKHSQRCHQQQCRHRALQQLPTPCFLSEFLSHVVCDLDI